MGQDAKVEKFFLRCAILHPRRAALYRAQIGWFFQRKKRWARALLWYDQALETFPGYHLGLFRKGYCLERLHRPREAAEAFQAAAESFDRAGADQQARSRGIQIQVLFHLARNRREIGETDAARTALDQCGALDDHPREIVIKPEHRLASYGETHLKDGNGPAAVEALSRARDMDPRSAVIWERLGRAHEISGDLDEAEAALRKATSLPKGAVAMISLGQFLIRQGRLLDAAIALSEALERHPPGEVQIRIELAGIERALGRHAAALASLERLAGGRVPPRSTIAGTISLHAARILVEHGHLKRAEPYVKDASRDLADDAAVAEELVALRASVAAEDDATERREITDAPLPEEFDQILQATPGRLRGQVISYFPDRGFGFIRHDGKEDTTFFHVSHCELPPDTEILAGQNVSFVTGLNQRNGKEQAEQVRLES